MYHVRQQAYANVVYIRSLWSCQSHQTHLQWQNLRYCWEECSLAFGCSANKQQSPKQKPALVKPPMLVNTKELTLLTGVETLGYRTDSHLDLRVQCENQSFTFETCSLHSSETGLIIGTIGRSVTWEQGTGSDQ